MATIHFDFNRNEWVATCGDNADGTPNVVTTASTLGRLVEDLYYLGIDFVSPY